MASLLFHHLDDVRAPEQFDAHGGTVEVVSGGSGTAVVVVSGGAVGGGFVGRGTGWGTVVGGSAARGVVEVVGRRVTVVGVSGSASDAGGVVVVCAAPPSSSRSAFAFADSEYRLELFGSHDGSISKR